MKHKYAFILFLLAFLLQTTLLNVIGVFGVTPNLLLCLVIVFSFLYDEGYQGLVLGIVFGLLYDISAAPYVGVAAIGFFIIALLIMLVTIVINKETVFSIMLVTIGSTCLYQLLYWGIMTMLGSNYGFLYMLRWLPIHIIYNTIVTTVIYFALAKKVIRHHKDRYYTGIIKKRYIK